MVRVCESKRKFLDGRESKTPIWGNCIGKSQPTIWLKSKLALVFVISNPQNRPTQVLMALFIHRIRRSAGGGGEPPGRGWRDRAGFRGEVRTRRLHRGARCARRAHRERAHDQAALRSAEGPAADRTAGHRTGGDRRLDLDAVFRLTEVI